MRLSTIKAARLAAVVLSIVQHANELAIADDVNFCQLLGQIVADSPKKFSSIATGRLYPDTRERDASIVLPGMQYCRIGLDIGNYSCWNAALTERDMELAAEKLEQNVNSCYPAVQSTGRVERSSSLIRSVTRWVLQNAQRVEVVRRVRPDQGTRNMVFFYVE